jgi:hypothetical protein
LVTCLAWAYADGQSRKVSQVGRQATVVSDEKFPQALERTLMGSLVELKRGQGATPCLVVVSVGDQLLKPTAPLPAYAMVRLQGGHRVMISDRRTRTTVWRMVASVSSAGRTRVRTRW